MFNVSWTITGLERSDEFRFFFNLELVYSNSITHRYRFDRCSVVRDRRGSTVVYAPSVRRDGQWLETVSWPFEVRRGVTDAVTVAIENAGGW